MRTDTNMSTLVHAHSHAHIHGRTYSHIHEDPLSQASENVLWPTSKVTYVIWVLSITTNQRPPSVLMCCTFDLPTHRGRPRPLYALLRPRWNPVSLMLWKKGCDVNIRTYINWSVIGQIGPTVCEASYSILKTYAHPRSVWCVCVLC